jgi:hypothetical protein
MTVVTAVSSEAVVKEEKERGTMQETRLRDLYDGDAEWATEGRSLELSPIARYAQA